MAADGLDALTKCSAAGTFDVIGTDYRMPNMDGLTLVKTLREKGFSGLIVVFAAALPSAIENAFRSSGVHAIIAKPIPFTEVAETINAIARRSS